MTRIRTVLLTMAAAASLSLAAFGPAWAAPFGDRGGGGFPLGGRGGITLNIPVAPSNGDRRCLSEAEIEAAIASGRIQSWARIRAIANIPKDFRETSDVQVCLRGGTPYFIVSMVSPKGEYSKIVLNAVDGSN